MSKESEIEELWGKFATESVNGLSIGGCLSGSYSMGMKLTVDNINKLLLNPQNNFQKLQQMSQYFKTKSGIYFRLIKYFSSILTYDYMIIPKLPPNKVKKYKKKIKDSFDIASAELQKMSLKYNFSKFAEDIFTDGEGYYYKIENATGIIYQKIPNQYCLPYINENNVFKYVIDCSKIIMNGNDFSTLPIEIQKAVGEYNNDKKNNNLIQGQYYFIKNGFCFITQDKGHGTPIFKFLMPSLLNLENKKRIQDNIDKVNNTKMIHNKIPINSKDGKPIAEPSVAKKYNDAIRDNLINQGLEEGMFSITNPFEAQILNLDTNAQKNISLVQYATDQIFNDMGISEMLFNSAKGGSEALKKSVILDVSYCINALIGMFTCYVNSELQNLEGEVKWICKILDTTYFNQDDRRKAAVSDLSIGGSIFNYFATQGLTPFEGMNLYETEKALNLDKILVIKATAHTMSGKDIKQTEDKAGRPDVEEMESKGEEISDITEEVNDNK